MPVIISKHIARAAFCQKCAVFFADDAVSKIHFGSAESGHFCANFNFIIIQRRFFIIGFYMSNRKNYVGVHQFPQLHAGSAQPGHTPHFKPAEVVAVMHNAHHISFYITYTVTNAYHINAPYISVISNSSYRYFIIPLLNLRCNYAVY